MPYPHFLSVARVHSILWAASYQHNDVYYALIQFVYRSL